MILKYLINSRHIALKLPENCRILCVRDKAMYVDGSRKAEMKQRFFQIFKEGEALPANSLFVGSFVEQQTELFLFEII